MKVLYFHQHFSSPKGSTAIRSYGMAQSLMKQGHEVIMVCGSYLGSDTGLKGPFKYGKRRGFVDGIDVIEFDLNYANKDNLIKRTKVFILYAFKGLKLLFSEKYDLIFSTSTPLTAGIPGIVSSWVLKKPFVFEVRDLWPELPKAMGVISNPFVLALMSFLEWLSYYSADHIIALSPGMVEGIKKRGVNENKISLIPNGCDLDIFNKQVKKWRPPNIKETDLLVLFAGTHGVANGLDSILDAAKEIKRRGRVNIKFLLVGQGKLKSSLMARANQESLDNVVFHDPVNKAQLAGLMASTDIGLQVLANIPVFYYGTSPNKFFDYISAGIPVLNNYPGWLAELINENDCGFFIPPEDPTTFADKLEEAIDNRSDLIAKGYKARALAVSQFDRKVLASKWVNQLEVVYSNKFKNKKWQQ